MDDFVYVSCECEYHHYDDVCRCEECDEYYLPDNGYHSDITGEDYCCDGCRYEAEKRYKEDHWTYAEYDDEYFEDEDAVTEYVDDFGRRTTISRAALMGLIIEERVKFNEETEIYEEV